VGGASSVGQADHRCVDVPAGGGPVAPRCWGIGWDAAQRSTGRPVRQRPDRGARGGGDGGCAHTPLAVNSWWPVVAGAIFLGVATGIAEVGMNAAAVDVEGDYGRPIMASFHAVFSVGNVLGALIGAAAFALEVGVLATAFVVAAIALAVVGTAATV